MRCDEPILDGNTCDRYRGHPGVHCTAEIADRLDIPTCDDDGARDVGAIRPSGEATEVIGPHGDVADDVE